jgi:hypothetical protein
MRLLRVELTRLRWRRAILFLTALSIILPVLIWAGMAWNTRPVSNADISNAQEQVERDKATYAADQERCLRNPEEFGVPDEMDVEEFCGEIFSEPQVDWYLTRPQLSMSDARSTGTGIATLLLGLALLMGATFAGADWSSGSMSNQLLFEPRRIRVWAAKASAVMIGAVAVAAVGLVAFWALTWGLMESRDIAATSGGWRDVAEAGARSAVFAGAAALGGFVVTMFLRSTVGTLGVMLAVSIGGSILVATLPIDGNGRWMLPHNVLGILDNGYRYYDYSIPGCDDFGGGGSCEEVLSMGEGLRFFGVLLAVGVALSMASFRRRDVP